MKCVQENLRLSHQRKRAVQSCCDRGHHFFFLFLFSTGTGNILYFLNISWPGTSPSISFQPCTTVAECLSGRTLLFFFSSENRFYHGVTLERRLFCILESISEAPGLHAASLRAVLLLWLWQDEVGWMKDSLGLGERKSAIHRKVSYHQRIGRQYQIDPLFINHFATDAKLWRKETKTPTEN